MNMWIAQCKAEITRMLRNKYFVFWSLFMPILFYYIFTRVVNTGVADQEAWQAHYLMSMTTFSVMGSSIMSLGIRLVQERTQGWTLYMRITPLSHTAYFFAKMASQTLIHLFSILVIFVAGILLNGVSLTVGVWIMSASWILVASTPFLALGTLVGTMKRVDTASGVSNVIYMVLAVCGGMWMPVEVFPDLMQRIVKWLPSYNFGNGAWEIAAGHVPAGNSIFILIGYSIIFMLVSNYIRRKQEVV
ncbi:ABC-2 type transport system permease protein [Fictibacillus solisalsi]|uniref:ABC-2 type transport system permease protein n=1 Tax=Fictibacillus solisalsi TaxID=459525 RepID=A0A1G9U3H8_9BACL|nr:ABC transporter permease [Fictibacillus solisalsi]SDM54432.1 ABC-2 type transport system permease protein [Fictibacillus solisalsi]